MLKRLINLKLDGWLFLLVHFVVETGEILIVKKFCFFIELLNKVIYVRWEIDRALSKVDFAEFFFLAGFFLQQSQLFRLLF
jgi:hypothetical protein